MRATWLSGAMKLFRSEEMALMQVRLLSLATLMAVQSQSDCLGDTGSCGAIG